MHVSYCQPDQVAGGERRRGSDRQSDCARAMWSFHWGIQVEISHQGKSRLVPIWWAIQASHLVTCTRWYSSG